MQSYRRRCVFARGLLAGVAALTMLPTLAAAQATRPAESLPRWRVLPIRSQAEAQLGLIGGEAEQHPQGMARSLSNPDRIYLSHDVGQRWRSDDNGRTWRKTLGAGMFVKCGQSVEVDPVDDDTVLMIVDSAWDWFARDYEGVYRSTDAGETWSFVLTTPGEHQRFHQHCLAYDPTSAGDRGASRWYAGFPANGLFASTDGGRSWTKVADLAAHKRLYGVYANVADGRTVYLASSAGLLVSTDRGRDPHPLGDLPAGEVSGLALHPTDPSRLYATVLGVGLFVSADGGRHFEPVRPATDTQSVFINPGHPEVIYVVSRGIRSVVSTDGGRTWRPIHATPAPGLDRRGNWKRTFGRGHTAILGDPRSATAAVAYSHATIWRSQDDPAAFVDSSTLFTGYAWGWWQGGVMFDPRDPQHFRLLCFDIGSVETRNGGEWFERDRVPDGWVRTGKVSWSGMYNGAQQPLKGSQVVVASAGRYWDTQLIRSDDSGETWTVVDGDTERHFFVGFHPSDPNLVFSGTKRSTDAGKTFQPIEGLRPWKGYVVGIAPSQPDTLYAISGDRAAVLRSDDRGQTWRQYTRPGWSLCRFSPAPLFAIHPTDPDRIYALDRHGDLGEFDGHQWRSLGVLACVGASKPRNCVIQVVFDPRRPQIVYAATHTCGLPFLFRSLDGGRTWQDISANLPRIGAGGLVVSPWTGDVFVGCCCGTWLFPPPYESPEALYHRLPDDWRTRRP